MTIFGSSKPVGNRSRAGRCGFAAIQCERIFDAPSCNRGQTHAFCLQIPAVRLTEQVACSKPNLDLEQSNKATCPHFFFFLFGEGSAAIAAKITQPPALFFGGAKNTRSGPGPAAPVVKNVGYESQMSGGASKPPTPLRARASDGAWSGRASVRGQEGGWGSCTRRHILGESRQPSPLVIVSNTYIHTSFYQVLQ